MSTTSKTSPFMMLLNRADEKLNKGAFTRHEPIAERLRTRHRFAWTDVAAKGELAKVPSPLGLGYLQGVLSVLHLFPVHMSYDSPGVVGRLTGKSTDTYHLSWNEDEGVECLQGGFVYSGKPNYMASVLGLAQAIAMYLSGERLQSEEVVTSWCALLHAMDESFPGLLVNGAGAKLTSLAPVLASQRVATSCMYAMRYAPRCNTIWRPNRGARCQCVWTPSSSQMRGFPSRFQGGSCWMRTGSRPLRRRCRRCPHHVPSKPPHQPQRKKLPRRPLRCQRLLPAGLADLRFALRRWGHHPLPDLERLQERRPVSQSPACLPVCAPPVARLLVLRRLP